MISCSSLIALIITGFEMRSSYNQRVADIERMHKEVLLVHGDLLVQQIWTLNGRSAQFSIDGLVKLTSIDRVELDWDGYDPLVAGAVLESADVETLLPLGKFHNGKYFNIGELRLFSNLRQVRFEIMSILCVRLFLNFLKTLFVGVVVIYFFHRVATVHLQKIASHADSLALGAGYKPLALDRAESSPHDELQTLVDAINGMGFRLQQDYLRSEGAQSGLEKLVQDRTQHLEKANQKLFEKSRLETIGSLVAMVAHELRNPLGTIKASISLLAASCSTEKECAIIDRIDRSIDRCDSTVEQLRRMGNKSVQHWEIIDLEGWLEDYVENNLLPNNSFVLLCDFAPELKVFVDEFQLDMAVRNLLENAEHAIASMAKGHRGSMSLHLYSENGFAVLQVVDNGVGLDSSNIEKSFDPLFSTKQYGFGMGLTLSRNLVEYLGGELSLDSKGKCKGATATLKLPLNNGE